MLEYLAIILIPMCLGYTIKCNRNNIFKLINQCVMILLYAVLFIMGVSLGQLDDLTQKLPLIAKSAVIFSLIICCCNLVGLMAYDKAIATPALHHHESLPSRWRLLFDSAKICFIVILGGLAGVLWKTHFSLPLNASAYVLIPMLFLIGIQLRNNGVSLHHVFSIAAESTPHSCLF